MSVLGYLNPLFHLLVNFIIAKLIGLTINDAILVGIFSLTIAIDHVINYLWIGKNFNLKKFIHWAKKEYEIHNPHFYIFHFIEFSLLLIYMGGLLNNSILILIGFSLTLHIVTDALHYFSYYKSINPWLNYLSLTAFITLNEKKARTF